MACAHAAGIAALLLSAAPDAGIEALRDALVATATPFPERLRHRCRYGQIDAMAALAELRRGKPVDNRPAAAALPCEPYHDPRLRRQLADRHDDILLKAVLVFSDKDAAEQALHGVCEDFPTHPFTEKSLLQGQIRIVRSSCAVLRCLLANPRVRIANAVDIDRL